MDNPTMDPALQEALCDKDWVHNPAPWGISFFRPDGTGWLDLSMEMRTHLRADFAWRLLGASSATEEEDGPPSSTAAETTATTTTHQNDERTKTTIASTRQFEIELTLLRTGPFSTPQADHLDRALVERAFRPRTMTARLCKGRFPRQHPFLGIVQVYGLRLELEPAVFPELQDWTEEYRKMATAGKFHEWKLFYGEALEDFEVEEPLDQEI
ncbi:hypothetical protein MAPG_12117 [Magnaporthiopsis poae ATCC 64411]|uniref:Uncharacterized protein n=1 Tax=Magnaporthiopsis poae (strain ATCC 64411 / 73-15) TaxID=644358 RepID=A0A0C4EGV7_MAGP6|nr:hypothetical protein MAPG_12117 [Magnaporthiopsis poae ATCC 64411]